MKGVLADVLDLAKPASANELKHVDAKIRDVDATIGRAQAQLKSLFGFESASKPGIVAGIAALNSEKQRLSSLVKFGGYGSLSLVPLKWRDKNGYPRIAIFSLASAQFKLSVEGRRESDYDFFNDRRTYGRTRYTRTVAPKLPKVLAECYSDVLDMLEVKAKERKKSLHLVTQYEGLIPSETRAKILDAKKHFKEIFLLAEGKNFNLIEKSVKTVERVNRDDPIVVGFDGSNLWVITSFDLTSVERMIATNFVG